MYAELEKSSPKLLDSFVNSLSWKGDPRRGWLAVGNSRGVVGVTYTESAEVDSDSWSDTDGSELEKQCMRRNFNFTEHSQEVTSRHINTFLCVRASLKRLLASTLMCAF